MEMHSFWISATDIVFQSYSIFYVIGQFVLVSLV